MPTDLTPAEARLYLTGHHGLRTMRYPPGAEGVRSLLLDLRCIQLDPLNVIGTNADLVAMVRIDGLQRGDVHRHLYPGHAFEHFAKERCTLPASAFPWYRSQAAETPWWRLSDRHDRLPKGTVKAVLDEIRKHGPLPASALTERGRVQPIDWSGWKGTAKASTMALEVLWTRCDIVVCGRQGNTRWYDVPERALPNHESPPVSNEAFYRWALLERVHAAGLLPMASGPWWSMLSSIRTSLPKQLMAEGLVEEVTMKTRRYLAPANFSKQWPAPDDRVRILGPLDPLLWDRQLIRDAFDFDYVWEVYKPAEQRRWGWYVCPLLWRGDLVGRLEAVIEDNALQVRRLWPERPLDPDSLHDALKRHARACGVERVIMPRRWRSLCPAP